jgi:ABC-2 type transport system permease protein
VVAQFLRLKLTLLRNTFRRNSVQLVGVVLGLIYAVSIALAVTIALVALRIATPEIARVIVVVFGSLIVLAFVLLPLAFGVDDTLDPRRFSLLGIPTTRLSMLLAVAACVSVPTLGVAIVSLAQIVTWSRGALPVLFAILAAIVIVPTCVLASRVSAALAASFLSSRRVRDVAGILLVGALAVSAPLVAVLATVDWGSQALPVLRRLAAVLAWTPLGAVWSAPGDAAVGQPGIGLLKLLIALVFLAVLALAWRALVGSMLVKPERAESGKIYTGLGWFQLLPGTPRGAIAARSLSYWGRDARYRASLAVIPVVPIVMVVALFVAGVPGTIIAWIPVPIMCLFLGWTVHNDVAHDSSAFWVHVSANTRGVDDRVGRIVPALVIGVPLVLLGSLVSAVAVGHLTLLPGIIGLSACVLFVGLGISSIISAGFPYPAVHPGDSPFTQPQAAGTTGAVVQSISLFVTLLLSAPVLALIVFVPGSGLLALGLGVLIGTIVLLVGLRVGGRIINRRAPELLAFTLQN